MFIKFWIISTIICWISIFLYVIIMTHKAKKTYTNKIKKSTSECIYIFLIALLLFSVPLFNVIFLAIILNQNTDDMISMTAKRENWEIKDKDNSDKMKNNIEIIHFGKWLQGNMPTADVMEVKHGKWLTRKDYEVNDNFRN